MHLCKVHGSVCLQESSMTLWISLCLISTPCETLGMRLLKRIRWRIEFLPRPVRVICKWVSLLSALVYMERGWYEVNSLMYRFVNEFLFQVQLCKVHGKWLLRREFADLSNLLLCLISTLCECMEQGCYEGDSLTYRILPCPVRVICKWAHVLSAPVQKCIESVCLEENSMTFWIYLCLTSTVGQCMEWGRYEKKSLTYRISPRTCAIICKWDPVLSAWSVFA